ncbi:hypothetical protein JOY44_04285 [Phormidium sp. CLA17]|uniref:hypothetical protein n=1 Tax=Leptolyngbya sp. Cla-17 TaxID=2803751 RepID=UPI0014917C99|nr:hypothetical protein [Leptolyngbya sp. Cla-17]MBM0740841.1 hypothetical protein [Leptolyngbya sp. Cla-17]
MLTLFAIPKAFRGEFDQIQRNAITSWTLLEPKPEIILLGDDEGTAEVAKEFGVKHVSGIERNEYGTPLLSSIFEIAQRVGVEPLFAYVNADIILLNDFMTTIQQIPFQQFMMTGQRWNLDFNEAIAPNTSWAEELRDRALTLGRLEGPQAMDYFVFPRDTYTSIPPFAIGRLCWDNWMLYRALNLNIPLIDATEAIVAIHQNHDYNHHPDGKKGVFLGEEAKNNLKLLGGEHYTYFMLDLADCQITPQGLRKPLLSWQRLDRRLDMLSLARPKLRLLYKTLLSLLRSGDQLSTVPSKLLRIPVRIVSRLKGLRRSKPSSYE